MKIAVVGSRTFTNYELVKNVLDNCNSICMIVSGGAIGADSMGEQYAIENGIDKLIIKPQWDKYGKRAGFIRNIDIIEASDEVYAFWDYKSIGTKHSIRLAQMRNKPCHIIDIRE